MSATEAIADWQLAAFAVVTGNGKNWVGSGHWYKHLPAGGSFDCEAGNAANGSSQIPCNAEADATTAIGI